MVHKESFSMHHITNGFLSNANSRSKGHILSSLPKLHQTHPTNGADINPLNQYTLDKPEKKHSLSPFVPPIKTDTERLLKSLK